MLLSPAEPADLPAVVALANLAYRQAPESWATESGMIEGTRLTLPQLRDDLAAKPDAHLLLARDTADGPLLGTVWLEPVPRKPASDAPVWINAHAPGTEQAPVPDTWYLGLLTIDPTLQNRQLGRTLLAAAEEFAQARGARTIRMTVLNVRAALIAWYERRGYMLTGETQPFPYGDERFGKPLRDDLGFVVLSKTL